MTSCTDIPTAAQASLAILEEFVDHLRARAFDEDADTVDFASAAAAARRAAAAQIEAAIEYAIELSGQIRSGAVEISGAVRPLAETGDELALPTRWELCELWLRIRRWPWFWPITFSGREAVIIEHGLHALASSLCQVLTACDAGHLFDEHSTDLS